MFGYSSDQADTSSFPEMDLGSSSNDLGSFSGGAGQPGSGDADLQRFLMIEQQRAEFQNQVNLQEKIRNHYFRVLSF